MKSMSYIQNFSNRRALIVCDDLRATEKLEVSLLRMGVRVEYIPISKKGISLSDYDLEPEKDILFIDGDLNITIKIPKFDDTEMVIIPVVGLVGIEAPSRLSRLLVYGATAFVKKPVHVGEVFFNLFMAINTHKHMLAVKNSLNKQKQKSSLRRYVLKAILIVMEQRGLDDESAYEWLRKKSMDEQITLEELSKKIVLTKSELEYVAYL